MLVTKLLYNEEFLLFCKSFRVTPNFILFFKNKRYNQKIKILMNSCQKIRETCVLMGPFDKYIFFGTQLYEI